MNISTCNQAKSKLQLMILSHVQERSNDNNVNVSKWRRESRKVGKKILNLLKFIKSKKETFNDNSFFFFLTRKYETKSTDNFQPLSFSLVHTMAQFIREI